MPYYGTPFTEGTLEISKSNQVKPNYTDLAIPNVQKEYKKEKLVLKTLS